MSRYCDLSRITEVYGATKTAATAQFVCGVVATFDDDDLLYISDGNQAVTFEIDATGGNTPAAGNIEIDISAAGSAIAVADLIRTAIEANLEITADAPGSATINLTQNSPGAHGNNLTPIYTPAVAGTGISSIVTFIGGGGTREYTPPRAHGVGK